SYVDPPRAKTILKIDGQEVIAEEFVYNDGKPFKVESTHTWGAGEHELTIEMQPLGPVGYVERTESGELNKNPLHLTIDKVTIHGPLDERYWVPSEKYARMFPRPGPTKRAARRAYGRELLASFAAQAD